MAFSLTCSGEAVPTITVDTSVRVITKRRRNPCPFRANILPFGRSLNIGSVLVSYCCHLQARAEEVSHSSPQLAGGMFDQSDHECINTDMK